ncbi:MAG: AAA family ATPase [Phycisphaerales bacterium]
MTTLNAHNADLNALPPGMGGGMVPSYGGPDLGGAPHQQVNVFKVLHNLFRGRYLLTIALAGTGAIIGLLLGWLSRQPEYASKTTIRIQPLQQSVTRTGMEVTPMFESFVNTQMNLILQDRVIRAAMSQPDWIKLGKPNTPEMEKAYRDSISVRLPSRTSLEIIEVTCTDVNPEAAHVGVTQLCKSYLEIFGDGSVDQLAKIKDQIRQDKRRQIEQKIDDIQKRLTQLAQDVGTDDPTDIARFLTAKRLDIQSQIAAIDQQLTSRGWAPPSEAKEKAPDEDLTKTAAPVKDPKDMTLEEIAAVDQAMSALIANMKDARSRKMMAMASGLGEKHMTVKKIQNEIDAVMNQMDRRREEWLGNKPASIDTMPAGQAAFGAITTESLLSQRESLKRQFRDTFSESSDLAVKIQEMRVLKQSEFNEQANLDELRKTIEKDQLDTDLRRQAGTITLLQPERPPTSPSNDSRIKFAAIFGFFGAFLPIAVMGLYGLFDRRYRYSDEAIEEGPTNTTLLGILPRLPTDLSDVEQASAAAHCVHQIRALVQIGGKHRRVYAVTSSNPGDGKTSMTLALGLSFAGSGSKTLIVDLDLIGQGLSRSMRMREQSSLFTELVDGDIKARIKPTTSHNLWLLPTGVEDDHRTANRLAEPQITRLIETVRDDYDIVLIDTGPVLGSIEAHLTCAQADGVILVVGAGRARGQVKAAVDQLRRVNAKLLGLVFNLAQSKDFRTSAASQSFRSIRPDGPAPEPVNPADYPEMEPLPRVVALDTKPTTRR